MKMEPDELVEKRNPNAINITGKCNQKCIFCSGYGTKDASIDEIKSLIDRTKGAVLLQGGEPTLNPRVFEIIGYIKSKGRKAVLVTNGLMLAYMSFAIKLVESGIDEIFFAFHAPEMELNDMISAREGSFDLKVRALTNISMLGAGGKVRLVYLINRHNSDRMLDYVRFIEKDFPSIKRIEFKLMQTLGNWERNSKLVPRITDFKENLFSAICEARRGSIEVMVNGIPACMLGDLFRHSVEYHMKSSGRVELSGRKLIEVCRECDKRDSCMGVRTDYLKIHGDSEIVKASGKA